MKVHELVARCAQAGESSSPMTAVREVLDSLRGDIGVDGSSRSSAGPLRVPRSSTSATAPAVTGFAR